MNSVAHRTSKRPCSFPECGRKVNSHDLCLAHSEQRRKGQALRPIASRFSGTIVERLERGTSKGAGCWEWQQATDRHGYGKIRHDGRSFKAHRVAYAAENGPISTGMQVDHICHNRRCVRPTHLQIVTNKQNQENRKLDSNNTSGARGVSWSKSRQRWLVQVGHHGVMLRVGFFADLEEAKSAAIATRDALYTNNLTDHPELIPG